MLFAQPLELVVDQILVTDPDARIVVAGDFNAEPDEVAVLTIRGDIENTGNADLVSRVLVPIEHTIPELRTDVRGPGGPNDAAGGRGRSPTRPCPRRRPQHQRQPDPLRTPPRPRVARPQKISSSAHITAVPNVAPP